MSRVNFYADNALIGSRTAAPFSVNWTAGAAGTYSFVVSATDNKGATTTSAPVTVTVENAAETALELQLKGGCSAVFHAISEPDVERIVASQYTMIASDGGVIGPQLQPVADHCGLSVDELVAIHAAPLYTVFALGSHPGYCYLGGMDPRITMPRRQTPLQRCIS